MELARAASAGKARKRGECYGGAACRPLVMDIRCKKVKFPGVQPLQKLSRPKKVKIANPARFPLQTSRTFAGKNRRDFSVVSDGCAGKTIAPRASCTLWVSFTPRAHGMRHAKLKITRHGRVLVKVQLTGAA
jgi:hypothetical protein